MVLLLRVGLLGAVTLYGSTLACREKTGRDVCVLST